MENFPGITLLGLGPGDPALLTRQAWAVLTATASAGEAIYLRTARHPVVAGFPAGLQVQSFDHLYDQAESFEALYAQIIQQVLDLGRRPQGVIYAVPGHPLVAETTGPEILRRARLEGLPVQVIEGLSFLEPVFSALGLDPFPHTALVDAHELSQLHLPAFPPAAPVLIAQVHSRQVASDVKLTLTEVYPDQHPVRLVHAAGTPDQHIEDLALYEIDRSPLTGLLTCLYLPPLSPTTSFEAFQEVIAHLRDPETGCAWDLKQTHATLRSHLLEETYELLDAVDANDLAGIREELGDLLLQVLMHAQIAADEGMFTMADILHGVHTKIVSRHPHVFGDLVLKDEQGVLENWERLKAGERAKNNSDKGLLDGVPVALPALTQAKEYQERAARVGFDWHSIDGVWDKLSEEIEELRRAAGADEQLAELGDLLFSAVNLARHLKIDPESALRAANQRFRRRFAHLEQAARAAGRSLKEYSLDELDALWRQAKAAE